MSFIQNSRLIEMIQAESARNGNSDSTGISPNSPPLLKASIMATFLLQLEILKTNYQISLEDSNDLRAALHFVFAILPTAREILSSPEFPLALGALQKDYFDATTGRNHP